MLATFGRIFKFYVCHVGNYPFHIYFGDRLTVIRSKFFKKKILNVFFTFGEKKSSKNYFFIFDKNIREST
jgi:hypothetical protein